ncbi:MAG: antibiotic biosynthesis monooxygenase [Pseudonocardiaceae bacterium]|nr:antibiotic biosynthesis monooxygenase [Pseudonocardiaceae bacterium]
MIGRLWRGRAAVPDAYENVFRHEVLDELTAVPGFLGAYLLRDPGGEFVALTLFDSLADVRRFAAADYRQANVSAAARAVLSDFDTTARHFDVVVAPD